MKLKFPFFKNRAAKAGKQLITEGSNVTRPGATVILTQAQRFGIGLDDYMQAIRNAENVDFTRRVKLYDIYSESLMDPHLFSVIQKRKSGVLARKIEFRRNGVPDEKVNSQISSPWFLRFLEDALDAQYWGFTLVQFFINEKGWIDYYQVPRKHVDPVLGVIKTRQTDVSGEPFDEYADLLMIRGKEPLGVLARTAPYVIYKRGTVGDWAQFSEIFGTPIRKYEYDAADPEARAQAMDAASMQGGAGVLFVPTGSNLTLVETGNTTGSCELYSALVDRCNAEMSKAVLGNTLTTEASETGTQALGTVHNKVEQELVEQDALGILNLLNYDMADQFAALGVDTAAGEFVYVEEADLEAVKAKAELLEKAVTVFGLPLDDDYLYEQLNIEKPDNYEQLKSELEEKKKAADPLAGLMYQAPLKDQPAAPTDNGKNPKQPQNRSNSLKKVFPQWKQDFRVTLNNLYYEQQQLPDPEEIDYMAGVATPLQCKADAEDEVSTTFTFDNKALQRALKHIYEAEFDPTNEIEENLFNETFRILMQATAEGIIESAAEVPVVFHQKLEQGNAVFSAFKVHRMQNDIATQLYDSNGVLKSFKQWKSDVHPMLDHHVEHWLHTEYDTAVIRSRQAADWQRFEQQADILPNLEWMPSTSIHPGADHKTFWGTILPLNHPFWKIHRPGDRWNCKCPLSATDAPPTGAPPVNSDPKNQPAPGLDNNPGIDGRLFSDTHPYITDAYEGAKQAVTLFLKDKKP